MKDWLSATWGANWRSFQYFNLYRLVMAGLFFLTLAFPREWMAQFDHVSPDARLILNVDYLAAVVIGLLLSIYWQKRFNFQLTLQVMVDVMVVTLMMLGAGGVGSGLGILLVVSLAAASLVGRGRLVLFYAAWATLALLSSQVYGILRFGFEQSTIVQAGLMSAGYFATAILARLLGQRAMINEDLARRRGEELDNQIRISQRVVERMQDGVLIVGPGGTVSQSNPVARTMLGLPTEYMLDLAVHVPVLAAQLAKWVTGDAPGVMALAGLEGRDLRARFERTSSSRGEVLVILEDLGRIKEQAQQMKLASLGRLTASIAHEIRNPLSAISHAGELLREERRTDVQERLLRILHDNVHRLDLIVKDVLELGRQKQALPDSVRLDEFCAGFVADFLASENLADDVLTFACDEAQSICFDRAHLHQVLWNLLSNALRHSSRGPGAVRITLENSDGRVELHVLDDGPGVPENVREQIFEPFFTTHHQGTGLGLFIARELCAANGASLELGPDAPGGHFVIAGRNEPCPLPDPNDVRAVN